MFFFLTLMSSISTNVLVSSWWSAVGWYLFFCDFNLSINRGIYYNQMIAAKMNLIFLNKFSLLFNVSSTYYSLNQKIRVLTIPRHIYWSTNQKNEYANLIVTTIYLLNKTISKKLLHCSLWTFYRSMTNKVINSVYGKRQ